ncbi:Protein of unknown function [Leuconostoc citreum]|nr:Protein of unknown function [Leuconostoc citreum LBAE E16]CDX64794.1 Protein of unknown function [Leuconostoc citreum]CDX66519.1 Protein of unknown function [Leuconostoc citreum]
MGTSGHVVDQNLKG